MNPRSRFHSTSLACLLLPLAAAAQGSLFPSPPQLSVDTHFPVPGSSVTYTIEAPSGSIWALEASVKPAEVPLGALGTLYLDPAARIPLGGGVVAGAESVDFVLAIPNNPQLVGAVLYAQAGAAHLPEILLTGSVAIRAEAAPPSGARVPLSVAVTPDGTRAFVANRDDGTVSVIDTATDAVLAEVPAGPSARALPHGPVHVAVDPEGRHAFALNAASTAITVLDAASHSVTHQLAVPKGCKRLAFDFAGASRVLYVTNDALDEVLVFTEPVPGLFAPQPPIPLEGINPGPVVVLSDGRLVVGNLGSHGLELLDPALPGASKTVASLDLGRLPYDLLVLGDELLVTTFTFTPGGQVDGINQVLRVSLPGLQVLGSFLDDAGTDYLDIARAGSFLAVTGAGSGSTVLASAVTGALLDVIDLAPLEPVATPQQSAFVVPAGGVEPTKLYTVNYFRDTVRPILLDAGPPFAAAPEIALAWSGAPRVPLADLTPEEDGDWFFRSVDFFNATPANPNPVTCHTCHPDAGSDGLIHKFNTPVMWRAGETGPYGWKGNNASLPQLVQGTFNAHGSFPGPPQPGAVGTIVAFLTNSAEPPPSPFLLEDGSLSPAAQAGQALFEGAAGCSTCHAPPLFIPPAPAPPTIQAGVGTGLVPANVPSLRGLWASEPYLHDASAATIEDVILQNAGNLHGTTSGLSAQQRADLVEYLRTL